MTNKKELKQEQLEKVSGGEMSVEESEKIYNGLQKEFPNKISEQELNNYKGQELLFVESTVMDGTTFHYWYLGTLIIAQTKAWGCGEAFVATIKVNKCWYEDFNGKEYDLHMEGNTVYAR